MSVSRVLDRNHVSVMGEGAHTLVFAHGFGCDQQMWRFVAPDLARDHRVVLFDYVGCGRSDASAWHPERYGSLKGYAQDIIEVCDALGLSQVVFVGHSVSSMIGALAAIARPDLFAHLVMVGPSPRYINDPPAYMGGFEASDIEGLLGMMESNMIGWANYLAPVVMQNTDRQELSQELANSFCAGDPAIGQRFARLVFFGDNRADLPDVQVPVLVMQCSEDAIAPETVGQYVHEHLPNSTYVKLQATGHCPHMSHPQETIDVLRHYLHAHGL